MQILPHIYVSLDKEVHTKCLELSADWIRLPGGLRSLSALVLFLCHVPVEAQHSLAYGRTYSICITYRWTAGSVTSARKPVIRS